MSLVRISSVEGLLSQEQKAELIRKVTDAVVSVKGEHLRPHCWVVLEEIKSGEWGVGGEGVTTEMVKAIQAGKSP